MIVGGYARDNGSLTRFICGGATLDGNHVENAKIVPRLRSSAEVGCPGPKQDVRGLNTSRMGNPSCRGLQVDHPSPAR